MRATLPGIDVRNLQRKIAIDCADLKSFAQRAVKLCLEIRRGKRSGLRQLREILILAVSDRKIAALHRQFMNVPGPTDVITFQHGEIFISAEMARRNAKRFGGSLQDELCLYIVHGLLHLHGFDDRTEGGSLKMQKIQRQILDKAKL